MKILAWVFNEWHCHNRFFHFFWLRTFPTKTDTGTKIASSVPNAANHWWTNHLLLKMTFCFALSAIPMSTLQSAPHARKPLCQVQCITPFLNQMIIILAFFSKQWGIIILTDNSLASTCVVNVYVCVLYRKYSSYLGNISGWKHLAENAEREFFSSNWWYQRLKDLYMTGVWRGGV